MEWKKVVAIIRTDRLEQVENRLKKIRVRGISITKGKGYGEYANFFTSDWFSAHARLEIYCKVSRTDEIVKVIMDACHSGMAGDGLVAVIPVEKVYRIRTMAEGNDGDV